MRTVITVCPYCGGTEFGEKTVRAYLDWTPGVRHQICLSCGSVVYSYVDADPDEMNLFRPKPKKPKSEIRKAAERIFLVPDPQEGEKKE